MLDLLALKVQLVEDGIGGFLGLVLGRDRVLKGLRLFFGQPSAGIGLLIRGKSIVQAAGSGSRHDSGFVVVYEFGMYSVVCFVSSLGLSFLLLQLGYWLML